MNALHIQKGQLRLAGAIGIFAAAALIGLVSAWQTFGYFSAQLRDSIENELLTIMHLKRESIEQFLRERRGDGAVLAARPAVWTVLSQRGDIPPALVRPLALDIETTRKAYDYRRIIVFDANRRAIHPGDDNQVEPHVAEALSETLATGQPV